MKTALIIGHTGQDGYYLTRFLEEQKQEQYIVYGVSSKEVYCSNQNSNDNGSKTPLPFVAEDRNAVKTLIENIRPDEVYYLAAYHHSSTDKALPDDDVLFTESIRVNCTGFVNVLEALKVFKRTAKVFYAASSHVFGLPLSYPQTENTPFAPVNIYGISKVTSIHTARYYQQQYGMFISCGILYNHESPRRGLKFVTQKIIYGALDVVEGKEPYLELGDPNARIDWGYVPDYVEAFYELLHCDQCGTFIIASGKLHTVGQFAQIVLELLGVDETASATYIRAKDGLITKQLNGNLCGDTTKIEQLTRWKPKVSLKEMIQIMLDAAKEQRAS